MTKRFTRLAKKIAETHMRIKNVEAMLNLDEDKGSDCKELSGLFDVLSDLEIDQECLIEDLTQEHFGYEDGYPGEFDDGDLCEQN